MKTVSTLNLRSRLGEIIDQVRFHRTPIIVLKNRKPVARIVPLEQKPQPKGFDIKKYRQLMKRLPAKYQVGDPDPELLALVGSGDYVAWEDENKLIEQYLRQKHG